LSRAKDPSFSFTLLVLRSGFAGANQLYHLAAIVITASMILYSSTDVLVARWFPRDTDASEAAAGDRQGARTSTGGGPPLHCSGAWQSRYGRGGGWSA